MASQTFLDKLGDTRTAVQALVAAIRSAYYNKTTVDEMVDDPHRFKIPTKDATLTAPIKLMPDNAQGSCTYTLPAAPAEGDTVEWRPAEVDFSVNNMVFLRNGKTILGQADDLTVNSSGSCGRLVWSGTQNTWVMDFLGYDLRQ